MFNFKHAYVCDPHLLNETDPEQILDISETSRRKMTMKLDNPHSSWNEPSRFSDEESKLSVLERDV